MKTKYYSILAIGLLMSVACACNKASDEIPAPADRITVHATLPDATRVVATDRTSGEGLSWAWEEGDAINVVGTVSSVLTIDEGFSANKATFSGKPVPGDSFDIIYPSEYISAQALEGMPLDEQSQKSVDSKDHIQYFAILEGLKAIQSFEFSPAWAEANGATLRRGGVLRIAATMPAETVVATRVNIKASAPVFHADNGETMTDALSLAIGDPTLAESKTLTAWLATSWHDTPIPAGTVITVSVAAGDFTWLSDISFSEEKTIKAGCVNTITIPAGAWYNSGRYAGGAGTADNPWLISTPEQMNFIKEDLVAGDIRYYKLSADIDMSDIKEWEPLNYDEPYDKQIDFDGAGHTISGFSCEYTTYPSFFGVLYGKCYDLTFDNAAVICSNKTSCGILGGYAGTGDKHAEVTNVHVRGTVENTSSKTGTGGLFGVVGNADISRCSAEMTITSSNNYTGGLFGYASGASTISDCWTSGSISANQRAGGICGGITKQNVVIRNCYSLASVTAAFALGGIAGHCNEDKGDEVETRMPNCTFEKCIAWNESVKSKSVTPGAMDHYSAGAIVGFTSTHNTLADCVRKADLDFADYSDLFGLYDQENASPENPLVTNKVEGAAYNYPYHGKAAAAGASLSQVAQGLGWSADIWDFSTDTPVLK